MENEMNENRRDRFRGTKVGVFLLLFGLVLLGFNYDIIPSSWKNIIISWQMLIIFIGVVKLVNRQIHSGMVMLGVGFFFLIPQIFPTVGIHLVWPFALIFLGLYIILHRVFGHKFPENDWKNKWYKHRHQMNHHRQTSFSQWDSSTSTFSKNSVFGSGEHIVLDPEFHGGDINAVFGGILLDLRRTNLPEGDTLLEVNAVFGGVTIYVPTNWVVVTQLDAVFGGFQDKRLPGENLDTTRKLILSGACVFGGGEIRN
ncbi:MAG: LiaF-related protein [Bacteroidales bacterium]|nr:LiaF-related protein [Bacteroidales bacterium]